MAFLTYPATPQKGVENEVTLSKMEMFGSGAGLGDESFLGSISRSVGSLAVGQTLKTYGTNLKRAMIDLRTPVGGQSIQISFDMTGELPTGSFQVSDRARDDFELSHVVLIDRDDEEVRATRSQITGAAENDLSFA